MAERRDTFAFIRTGNGMEFTAGNLALDAVEERSNHINATRVAANDEFVGYLLGTQMKMEHTAVFIDNQF
jgi:hypothetical protein